MAQAGNKSVVGNTPKNKGLEEAVIASGVDSVKVVTSDSSKKASNLDGAQLIKLRTAMERFAYAMGAVVEDLTPEPAPIIDKEEERPPKQVKTSEVVSLASEQASIKEASSEKIPSHVEESVVSQTAESVEVVSTESNESPIESDVVVEQQFREVGAPVEVELAAEKVADAPVAQTETPKSEAPVVKAVGWLQKPQQLEASTAERSIVAEDEVVTEVLATPPSIEEIPADSVLESTEMGAEETGVESDAEQVAKVPRQTGGLFARPMPKNPATKSATNSDDASGAEASGTSKGQ